MKAKFTLLFACYALAVASSEANPFLKQPGITETWRTFFTFENSEKSGNGTTIIYMTVGRIAKDTVKNTK